MERETGATRGTLDATNVCFVALEISSRALGTWLILRSDKGAPVEPSMQPSLSWGNFLWSPVSPPSSSPSLSPVLGKKS